MLSDSLVVEMRHEFWLTWGRIALKEAERAESARAQIGSSRDSADDSRALDEELNAGVVAICAAAFSVEALAILLGQMAVPADTLSAWSKNNPKAVNRLRETLKHGLQLKGPEIEALVDSFGAVIKSRGLAVHYEGNFEPPEPHPAVGQSSRPQVTYGLEQVRLAIASMEGIYAALLDKPKSSVAGFVQQQRQGLLTLAGRTEASSPGTAETA